jgi:hypothetical protein
VRDCWRRVVTVVVMSLRREETPEGGWGWVAEERRRWVRVVEERRAEEEDQGGRSEERDGRVAAVGAGAGEVAGEGMSSSTKGGGIAGGLLCVAATWRGTVGLGGGFGRCGKTVEAATSVSSASRLMLLLASYIAVYSNWLLFLAFLTRETGEG